MTPWVDSPSEKRPTLAAGRRKPGGVPKQWVDSFLCETRTTEQTRSIDSRVTADSYQKVKFVAVARSAWLNPLSYRSYGSPAISWRIRSSTR